MTKMCSDKILKEKARLNLRETNEDIFPYEKYDVHICNDDLESPHLHIVKDGWNVSFLIETGELHKNYA